MTGEQFRNLRKSIDKTQQEYADLLGVSLRSIKSYESGETRISKAMATLATVKTESALAAPSALNEDTVMYKKSPSTDDMYIAVMANTTTSSVVLELLCEVVARVTGSELGDVKDRARKLAQDKATKLGHVMTAIL